MIYPVKILDPKTNKLISLISSKTLHKRFDKEYEDCLSFSKLSIRRKWQLNNGGSEILTIPEGITSNAYRTNNLPLNKGQIT